jgi:hypothetical protein
MKKAIRDRFRRLLFRAGIFSVGLGPIWAVATTWLAAHGFITVIAELASVCLCLVAVFLGGWCACRTSKDETKKLPIGLVAAALWIFVVVWAWLISDLAFFHWKLRSLPPNTWARMVSDMRQMAKSNPDAFYLPANKYPPPMSVRKLGLGDDYSCMHVCAESSAAYPGVRGDVLFGYKVRNWGLWLGPEKSLNRFCPGCRRTLVAPKTYFFVGPRG